MFGALIPLAIIALLFGGAYYWARRRGLVEVDESTVGKSQVSLLTEAIAYIGAILVIAGGGAALAQRWDEISDWGHVGILGGGAAFFLGIGTVALAARDVAFQRLSSVAWFVSVGGIAGATGFAVHDIYGFDGAETALSIGVAITVYAGALWLIRRRALQQVALFVGFIVAIVGAINMSSATEPPPLALSFALWGFGLAWATLGIGRIIEPIWVSMPLGVIVSLIAPSFALEEHGWMYAIGIGTAAVMMAASVRLRFTLLLGMGTVAMFGYVTSVVVRYFRDTLGVPAALAMTGALILGLAAVTARLMRATRPPTPEAGGDVGIHKMRKAS